MPYKVACSVWTLEHFLLICRLLFIYAYIEIVIAPLPQGAINKDAFPPEIIEAYKYAVSRPGALTGCINYYRCMLKFGITDPIEDKEDKMEDTVEKIKMPTLLIWVCVLFSLQFKIVF